MNPSYVILTKTDGKHLMLAWANIVGFEDREGCTIVYVVTHKGAGSYEIREKVTDISRAMNKK